ncbi:hypothetical protein OSB04_un001678 [Centaurea solstitialis]|uniref:Uncharacterized protein n=1 Tax=Centaurea solstitialis TaxID=347529 RepID=A0AA38W1I6_9ASTR|nr:hypothetical protein OSB04_un001678 [Centaurea solstitialis]
MAVLLHSAVAGFSQVKTPIRFTSIANPSSTAADFIGVSRDRNYRRRIRVRVRVSSRIKDLEPWILSDVTGSRSSAATSVKPSKEDEEKQDYYVNTGNAIRTLREEFPELFYRDLSFDIYRSKWRKESVWIIVPGVTDPGLDYKQALSFLFAHSAQAKGLKANNRFGVEGRDDIVFKDPLNTFVGIENYKSILWALRFNGRIFFKALWVDIVSVWQPSENTIMIRWIVHGIPRVPWESRGRFDATSEYKLDKNGKIYEHRVHNIALNAPPRFKVISVNDLIRSLSCPSLPKPTYFEVSLASLKTPYSSSEPDLESSLRND